MGNDKKLDINFDDFQKEGIYLQFPDGSSMDFSKERIKQLADEYWNNPVKIPPHIREQENFKTCEVCPYKGQNVFCSAMKPLLPFLEEMEKFTSYDKVMVVYIAKEGILHASETTMQGAMQYVANMALFEYCEDTKQYKKYFTGITPLMDSKKAMCKIFLNIYWLSKGNSEKAKKILDDLNRDVTCTATSCVKRLNTICKSDVFMNAYVKTQTITDILSMSFETLLEKYFNE